MSSRKEAFLMDTRKGAGLLARGIGANLSLLQIIGRSFEVRYIGQVIWMEGALFEKNSS
jgi:hypothetical protein